MTPLQLHGMQLLKLKSASTCLLCRKSGFDSSLYVLMPWGPARDSPTSLMCLTTCFSTDGGWADPELACQGCTGGIRRRACQCLITPGKSQRT